MSLWINRWKCNKCGETMNVQGGMVQTTWMGPVGGLDCPNESCDSQWPDGFTNEGSAIKLKQIVQEAEYTSNSENENTRE